MKHTWSAVKVYHPYFDRWAVYRSDCRYMTRNGEWSSPMDGAEFDSLQAAQAHGRIHAPECEYRLSHEALSNL